MNKFTKIGDFLLNSKKNKIWGLMGESERVEIGCDTDNARLFTEFVYGNQCNNSNRLRNADPSSTMEPTVTKRYPVPPSRWMLLVVGSRNEEWTLRKK